MADWGHNEKHTTFEIIEPIRTLNVTCTSCRNPPSFTMLDSLSNINRGKQKEFAGLHNEEDDTRHAGGGVETGFIYPNLCPGDNRHRACHPYERQTISYPMMIWVVFEEAYGGAAGKTHNR